MRWLVIALSLASVSCGTASYVAKDTLEFQLVTGPPGTGILRVDGIERCRGTHPTKPLTIKQAPK